MTPINLETWHLSVLGESPEVAVAISGNGKTVFVAERLNGSEGRFAICDLPLRRVVRVIDCDPVLAIAASPSGQHAAVLQGSRITLFGGVDWLPIGTIQLPDHMTGRGDALCFSDDSHLACAYSHGVCVWSLLQQPVISIQDQWDDGQLFYHFGSCDGELIVITVADGSETLEDAPASWSPTRKHALTGYQRVQYPGRYSDIFISGNCEWIACRERVNGAYCVYNVRTLHHVATISENPEVIRTCGLSHDGSRFVQMLSLHSVFRLSILDSATGLEIAGIPLAAIPQIHISQFNPFVSMNTNNADIDTDQMLIINLTSLDIIGRASGHPRAIPPAIAFSPTGTHLVTACTLQNVSRLTHPLDPGVIVVTDLSPLLSL